MAAQPGSGGLDPPDLRLAGGPHAAPSSAPAGRCRGRFSTFDYRQLCDAAVRAGRRGRVRDGEGRGPHGPHGAYGPRRRHGAADRRCTRLAPGARAGRQRPAARTGRSRAAWRCIRPGVGEDLELWIDPRYVDAGYGWSFPARDELRIGVGSFDPHDPVKQPTLRLVEDVDASPRRLPGQLDPHRIRPATEDGVFFAGDSAGHCLPLTAEGIRTAFYFGIALGRELRAVRRGPPGPRGGADALRGLQRLAPLEVRGDVSGAAVDPPPARAPAGRAHADLRPPQRSPTGPSGTTWTSRRRSSRSPRRPPHCVRAALRASTA